MLALRERLKKVEILRTMVRTFEAAVLRRQSRQEIFTQIYKKNKWNDDDSRSGTGSNLNQTRRLREELPRLLKQLEIKTLLDVPCGDFHWMEKVDLRGIHYIGGDITAELIANNQKRFAATGREFRCLDLIAEPLPHADLIFCRDALVHFSFADVRQAIANIRASGARYLATTTFVKLDRNADIATGQWRPLNLEKAPFFFPKPTLVIDEECTEANGKFADKCIAVWKIEDLPK